MIKTQIFMAVTAFISIVCFNFNKIISYGIQLVCANMYDDSIITWGPYNKSLPIDIHSAYTNTEICTNKLQLFVNWKWNFDMHGISKSELEEIFGPNIQYITIVYCSKHHTKDKLYTCIIDLKNNTFNIKGVVKRILFDEVRLLDI